MEICLMENGEDWATNNTHNMAYKTNFKLLIVSNSNEPFWIPWKRKALAWCYFSKRKRNPLRLN